MQAFQIIMVGFGMNVLTFTLSVFLHFIWLDRKLGNEQADGWAAGMWVGWIPVCFYLAYRMVVG